MANLSVYSHNYILDSLETVTANKNLKSLAVAERIPVVILVAFLYEAIANHYGCIVHGTYKGWKKASSKKSPIEKIEKLYASKGVEIDFHKHPFTTLRSVFSIRNAVAHSKTHSMVMDQKVKKGELPEPSWIIQLKSLDLDVAINDQKLMLKNLPALLGLEQVPSLILSEVRCS